MLNKIVFMSMAAMLNFSFVYADTIYLAQNSSFNQNCINPNDCYGLNGINQNTQINSIETVNFAQPTTKAPTSSTRRTTSTRRSSTATKTPSYNQGATQGSTGLTSNARGDFCSPADSQGLQSCTDFDGNTYTYNPASDEVVGDRGAMAAPHVGDAPTGPDSPSQSDAPTSEQQAAMEQCSKDQERAQLCCTHPDQCLMSGDNAETGSSAVKMLTMTMGQASQSAASVAQMCSAQETAGNVTAGLNAYMAQQCNSAINSCSSSCEVASQYYASNGNSEARDSFAEIASECKKLGGSVVTQASQAVAAQMSAQMAAKCKNAAATSDAAKLSTADLFANPDCNSAQAASTAFCQEKCNTANGKADPSCAGFWTQMQNGGLLTGATDTNLGKGNNPFDAALKDSIEGTQTPNIGDIAAKPTGLTSQMGGSSLSGLGGGGAGGGGGSDGGAQGAAGPGGYDTGVDQGLRGGGGYSVSSMRTGGGGGFSGYGTGRSITSQGKPFNLRDFLPGGKKSKLPLAPLRGLAMAKIEGVGPAHADIFQKVTNRFYQVCLRNALYDCASIQKMHKSGN